jgi:hypothetical protein
MGWRVHPPRSVLALESPGRAPESVPDLDRRPHGHRYLSAQSQVRHL